MTHQNILGARFGRLVAKESFGKKWLFVCDCGAEKLIFANNVKRGLTKSCGCLNKKLSGARGKQLCSTHGMSKTSEYKIWQGMRQRCENENDKDFPNYGGRGIRVCDRWGSFENFLADMGPRPAGMSIDRKKVDGNYSPSNCRWATPTTQNRNRRDNLLVERDGQIGPLSSFIPEGCHSAEYQRARKLVHRTGNRCV